MSALGSRHSVGERFDSAASPARGPLARTVALITDASDFAGLSAQWSDVAAQSSLVEPFSWYEWFEAAWQWRRQTGTLYVLCLLDDRRLIAVLPLVMETTSNWGIRRRELSFLTVPDTQTCDLIVAGPDSSAAATAFVEELDRRRDEWDVIRLNYLAPKTITASLFRAAMVEKRFATRLEPVAGNLFLSLDASWETYYATRSRRLKKVNNLAANRLKKTGEVRIERLAPGTSDAAEVQLFLDRAIAISAKSWKTRTGNSLDNLGPQSFIRCLSHAAHKRGWLSIWTLSLDNRPLAMEYQLVANGRVYALRSDFDAEFEDISPGTHLNRCLLEQLFGSGLRRYYMGPGNNAYKHRWAEQVEPVEELTVYGRSVEGRRLAAWETTLKPLARTLRDRLQAFSWK